jgi:hypothetical protein
MSRQKLAMLIWSVREIVELQGSGSFVTVKTAVTYAEFLNEKRAQIYLRPFLLCFLRLLGGIASVISMRYSAAKQRKPTQKKNSPTVPGIPAITCSFGSKEYMILEPGGTT